MAQRRQLDVIVVWRLDRWGRSLADMVHSLKELRARKVDFASVTESLDFSTPAGRAMSQMLGVFGEFERNVLRDRVRAGMEQARSKGKVLGRPTTARNMVGEIQQLLAEGISKKEIAKRLGVGRASIYRVLEVAS
jgi:putative DNA-invertase from lambdoid prophage Rac